MLRNLVLLVLVGHWAVHCHKHTPDPQDDVECPKFDAEEIEEIFKDNKDLVKEREALEKQLILEGKFIKDTEFIPDVSLLRQADKDPKNRQNEFRQIYFEAVTDRLVEKYDLTRDQVNKCLPKIPLNGPTSSKYRDECKATRYSGPCDPDAIYRSPDGTCNNLENPFWGAVGSCFRRLAPARYNGNHGIRQSVLGGPLPEPRDISLNVHNNLDLPTHDVNNMYMFIGQFIDHEFTQAPISCITDDIAPIKCCIKGGVQHPQCLPVTFRDDDPFFSQFNTTCFNIVRAATCPTCTLGPRQQVNQISSYIDGGNVYGTTQAISDELRTNDGTGRMRVQKTLSGDLVPPHPNPYTDRCSFPETQDYCFKGGDVRTNEHPMLGAFHSMFVRQHNIYADGLKKLNPSWDGEKIFQTARNIISALTAQLIYNEFLPATLGYEYLDRYDLRVSDKKRTKYDPNQDPSIINSFNAAAFRYGHSMITSILYRKPLNSTGGYELLMDKYFQGYDMVKVKDALSTIVKSTIVDTPAQTFDQHLVPDVTNFLYKVRGTKSGLDLASLNLQRGRDQGLPTYVDMFKYCSSYDGDIDDFDTLVQLGAVPESNAKVLAENYKSVRDVDLWTGMLSENHVKGGVVGPTAACVIGEQFRAVKFGDRFFYEHKKTQDIGSLTYRQLQDIKKMTITKFICLTTDIDALPQNSLYFPSESNPLIPCSEVKGINLSLWS